MANNENRGFRSNQSNQNWDQNWEQGNRGNRYNDDDWGDTGFNSDYDQQMRSGYGNQRRNINDSMRRRDRDTRGYDDMYGRYENDRGYNAGYGRERDDNRGRFEGYEDWQNMGYRNQYNHDQDWDRRNNTGSFDNRQREDWGRANVNAGMGNQPGRGYGGYTGRDYGHGTSYGAGDYRHNRDRYEPRNRYGGDTSNYGNANQGGYDRDWWEKTRDEVSSWFGDEDAERRRERDRRMDEGGSYRGRGPKDYSRSEDRIREDVCDRLTDDSWLDASNVQVEVKGNDVILSGTVNNRIQKRRAEDLVDSISGVRNVENRIRINQQDDRHDRNREGTEENNSWKE